MKRNPKGMVVLWLFSLAIATVIILRIPESRGVEPPEHKVHLNVRDIGETGLDVDEIKSAFIKTVREKDRSGITFVDEEGEDVRELNLTVLQDDKDDDNDGIEDAEDKDSENDGVEDNQENVAVVDVDKNIPEASYQIQNADKTAGLMVVLSLTNADGELREARLVTAGDSFEKDFDKFLNEMEVWMFLQVSFLKTKADGGE